MEEAAACWGHPQLEIMTQLCLHIAHENFDESCCKIIECLQNQPLSLKDLQEQTGINDSDFTKSINVLHYRHILFIDDVVTLQIDEIFHMLLVPQFLSFAQEYVPIPQDAPYVTQLVRKVLDEQTLTPDKLANSVATQHVELDVSRLLYVIDHMLKKHVLAQDENSQVSFNQENYLSKLRKRALLKLVENNDHRVQEVVDAIFSQDLYESSLAIAGSEIEFQQNDLIGDICNITGLSDKEVNGILDILRTPEYSLINPTEDKIMPTQALFSFKLKRIGQLLAEIGYPYARRIINLLLKHEQMETVMLCDTILMSLEDGRQQLEKLKFLGVLDSDTLENAPHTTLRRQYILWKIDLQAAINNAASYLLGVYAKVYFDLQNEQKSLDSLSNGPSTQTAEMKKKGEAKLMLLNNTLDYITTRYIEIYEL